MWTDDDWLKHGDVMARMLSAFRTRHDIDANNPLYDELREAAADALVSAAEKAIEEPPRNPEAYLVTCVTNALKSCLGGYRKSAPAQFDERTAVDQFTLDDLEAPPSQRRNGQPYFSAHRIGNESSNLPPVNEVKASCEDEEHLILESLMAGEPQAVIADALNVHPSTISRSISKIRARAMDSWLYRSGGKA